MYYEHPTIRNGATGGGLTIDGNGKLCDENGAPANVIDPARQASLDNFGFKVCAGPKSAKKKSAGKKDEDNGDKKDEGGGEGGGEDTPAPKKAATPKSITPASKKSSKKSRKK